eukprot:Gregarina_sp_Poly_1__10870@NODE_846_length_5999_cov_216_429872_g611_i0_p6_GENE_NODE_846_length_5999_cov_216_429872_g611_i0NODE_846_length_5999_cov_216_429872_g611_i0_p6_ORF_typecomplete_len109_score9_04_NODE_846_length_5999_cov_216_429872_g611_i032443570
MRFEFTELADMCPCVAFLVLVIRARLSREANFHCEKVFPQSCLTDGYLMQLRRFGGLRQNCSISDLREAHESLVQSLESVATDRLVVQAIPANQRARAMTSATATPVF